MNPRTQTLQTHKVKSLFICLTTLCSSCMLRCKKTGSTALFQPMPSTHTRLQETNESISPTDTTNLASTQLSHRNATARYQVHSDAYKENLKTWVATCGCVMQATPQGKKVVLSSNGQTLMTMVNLLGRTKSNVPKLADESMTGMSDLLHTRQRMISESSGSVQDPCPAPFSIIR
jgi:hypothetical protein